MEKNYSCANESHSETPQHITVQVLKGTPSENRVVKYRVPLSGVTSVLGILTYIQENLDPTVAFYSSCRMGKCSGCYVRVNGSVRLACTTTVDDDISIEPVDKLNFARDLVPARAGRKGTGGGNGQRGNETERAAQ